MDSILFFDLILVISDLALALAITALYLFWITKGHISVNTRGGVISGNSKLLDEARLKAIKIIDEANNQAMDIISKATLTAATASDSFKDNLSHTSSAQIKEFEKATSDFTALYFQVLQDLKTKNIEVFQSLSKDIETNTVGEIKSFKESMQKLTILSQDEIKKKIDADYEIIKTEIGNHKKERMQKVDSEIYGLLEKISKLVLGKALSLSEHEELIEESIEKAKKEGIFG
jgi:hypothetical protein